MPTGEGAAVPPSKKSGNKKLYNFWTRKQGKSGVEIIDWDTSHQHIPCPEGDDIAKWIVSFAVNTSGKSEGKAKGKSTFRMIGEGKGKDKGKGKGKGEGKGEGKGKGKAKGKTDPVKECGEKAGKAKGKKGKKKIYPKVMCANLPGLSGKQLSHTAFTKLSHANKMEKYKKDWEAAKKSWSFGPGMKKGKTKGKSKQVRLGEQGIIDAIKVKCKPGDDGSFTVKHNGAQYSTEEELKYAPCTISAMATEYAGAKTAKLKCSGGKYRRFLYDFLNGDIREGLIRRTGKPNKTFYRILHNCNLSCWVITSFFKVELALPTLPGSKEGVEQAKKELKAASSPSCQIDKFNTAQERVKRAEAAYKIAKKGKTKGKAKGKTKNSEEQKFRMIGEGSSKGKSKDGEEQLPVNTYRLGYSKITVCRKVDTYDPKTGKVLSRVPKCTERKLLLDCVWCSKWKTEKASFGVYSICEGPLECPSDVKELALTKV